MHFAHVGLLLYTNYNFFTVPLGFVHGIKHEKSFKCIKGQLYENYMGDLSLIK